ncbi:hypothetical protein [Paraburkholderia tagetis]|uniref:Uncharacterized protein n=1 Tax=Paraburkholderia tagetis TaxID=2913261 RepID=A0A9X1RNS9_9BURK|nr:hypothetical protein [Paraburkholderia tagetis]MCG5073925.1 hypothetical protein [Paraburkholderia tagetis]
MSPSKPKPSQPSQEDALDEALEETFPASDPIAVDPPPSKPKPADDAKKGRDTHRHGKR